MKLRKLPEEVADLLQKLDALPTLVAHLTLTHDVAVGIVEALCLRWPELPLDRSQVAFGAAIHDVGKTVHPHELFAPGKEHECEGERLLIEQGVPAQLARFCRTHGRWNPESPLEDLLVALADSIWKGKRNSVLEEACITRISSLTHQEWVPVYLALDDIIGDLTADAELRLRWQRAHSAG
jgi:hypothetical protein